MDNPMVKIRVVGMDGLHNVTHVVLNSSMLLMKLDTKMMFNKDTLKEPARRSDYNLELGPSRKNFHLKYELIGHLRD